MAHTATIPRCNRPLDIGPSRDIDRSVKVGVCSIPARLAKKLGLGLTVGLLAVAAPGAATRRVAWVHLDKRQPRKPSLVPQKFAELVKRPTVQAIPSRFINPYPPSDTRQLLDGNPKAVVFSGLDNGLCNTVVGIGRKPALTTRELFQLPLSWLRASLLQTLPKSAVFAAYTLDCLAAVGGALRIRSKLNYAHIDAEVALNIFRWWLRHLTSRKKVELATRVDKVGLAMLKLKPPKLPLARAVKHFLASLERPNRHTELIRLPLEYAVVVGDSAVWPKGALRFAVELVGVSYLALTPHNHLRGKPEPLPNLVVHELVKAELLKGLRVPGHIRDVVARLVCSFQSGKQGSVLFGRGEQLHLGSQPHNDIIPHFQGSEASTAARQKGPDIRPAGYAPPRLERPGYPLRPGLFL